jgi:hypothetical protein
MNDAEAIALERRLREQETYPWDQANRRHRRRERAARERREKEDKEAEQAALDTSVNLPLIIAVTLPLLPGL